MQSYMASVYLISWDERDGLFVPVAPGATVDEVDTELLQLAHENLALLEAPILPFAVFALLWSFSPVCSADTHKERFVPGFTDAFGDLEGVTQAILEGSAVRVCTQVRERRQKFMEEVAVRSVEFYEINCLWILVDS